MSCVTLIRLMSLYSKQRAQKEEGERERERELKNIKAAQTKRFFFSFLPHFPLDLLIAGLAPEISSVRERGQRGCDEQRAPCVRGGNL